MARIRSTKPEFWSDERVGECSPSARLLFLGMWNFADDFGNIERSARQLKAQIFPYDNIDCEPLVQELINSALVLEYESQGCKFLNIKNFLKHQKIDKPSSPRCPLHPSQVALVESSPSPSGALPTEGKGREGRGEEGKGKEGRGRDKNTVCSEPSARSLVDPAANGKTIAQLPLNTGDMFPLTESQVSEWQKLFPAVDVAQQIREMVAWCNSNPTRRKTRAGILRFVTSWLGREQDQPSRSQRPQLNAVDSAAVDYTKGLKEQNPDGSYKF